jgi:hypothetical protein
MHFSKCIEIPEANPKATPLTILDVTLESYTFTKDKS